MNHVEIPKEVANAAEEVRKMTVNDAKGLPGFLGIHASARLQYEGFYPAVVDGKRVLFVVKAP